MLACAYGKYKIKIKSFIGCVHNAKMWNEGEIVLSSFVFFFVVIVHNSKDGSPSLVLVLDQQNMINLYKSMHLHFYEVIIFFHLRSKREN